MFHHVSSLISTQYTRVHVCFKNCLVCSWYKMRRNKHLTNRVLLQEHMEMKPLGEWSTTHTSTSARRLQHAKTQSETVGLFFHHEMSACLIFCFYWRYVRHVNSKLLSWQNAPQHFEYLASQSTKCVESSGSAGNLFLWKLKLEVFQTQPSKNTRSA